MRLGDLLKTIPFDLKGIPDSVYSIDGITDVTGDSREVIPGSIFIPILGTRQNGADFVKEAIQKEEKKPSASVQLDINGKSGIRVIVEKAGNQNIEVIGLKADGSFNYSQLQQKLVEIKIQNPEVFRVELNPEGNIPYKEIVKIIDEARKARDKSTHFPVYDSKAGKEVETDYMFPDVVFVNVMEG